MLDNAWSASAFTEAEEVEEEEDEDGAAMPTAETPSAWRGWGAFSALSSLDTAAVARLAGSALATVRRDFTEFGLAVREDAKELADVAADEALPELRHAAAGLQETLETVGEGIEQAGASFFANLAQARSPGCPARAAGWRLPPLPWNCCQKRQQPRVAPRPPHADAPCPWPTDTRAVTRAASSGEGHHSSRERRQHQPQTRASGARGRRRRLRRGAGPAFARVARRRDAT
jgi:hypothetical protein